MSEPTRPGSTASSPSAPTCSPTRWRPRARRSTRVDWRPPMEGTADDLADGRPRPAAAATANARAVEAVLGRPGDARRRRARVRGARPRRRASSCTPARRSAGTARPGPLRGALMGAAALEGLVDDPEDAPRRCSSPATASRFEPCHHRSAVGPMAGVVSPSMWMFVLEDPATGRRAYCSLNEGLGKVLRYGAYGPEVLDRLRWMSRVLGPLLRDAVRDTGPVDVTGILTQMLQMGDEAHNRNRAGTLMLLRDLAPAMVAVRPPRRGRRGGAAVHRRQRPLLPQPRDARLQARARRRPRHRGLDDGRRDGPQRHRLRHPGLRHRRRVVHRTGAAAPTGCSSATTAPTTPTPTSATPRSPRPPGIGGFSMATAPAIVRFVGGTVPDALATTRRMREITLAENPRWTIPVLEFAGAPTGIDVARGLPHRDPAADQHRHGRQGGRRRPGRRRARHPARRDLPPGPRRPRPHARARSRSTDHLVEWQSSGPPGE